MESKKVSSKDKVLLTFLALMPICLLLLPWKGVIFLICSSGAVFAAATQPWEIYRERDAGDVDVKFVSVYTASTVFWVIYSFVIQDGPMQILTTSNLVVFVMTLLFWFYYKE